MKIVQTFWSGSKDLLQDNFGWLSPQHHLMAWTLSCLNIKNFYEDAELYTDANGYDVLINQLGLPYKKVWVVLDDLQKYPKELWALAKVKTYSLQNEPFIHLDGDAFIWSAFKEGFQQADLVAQNLEKGTDYYNNKFTEVKNFLKYIPDLFDFDIKDKDACSCNAGVIGGTDFNFFKKYAAKVFDFTDGNDLNGIPAHVLTNFNILFEQVLFYDLAKKENKKITCLFDKTIDDCGYKYDEIADFASVPYVNTYLHLLGPNKRNEMACDLMSRILLKENPEYFFKVISLFKESTRPLNFSFPPFEKVEKEKIELLGLQYQCSLTPEIKVYNNNLQYLKQINSIMPLLMKALELRDEVKVVNSDNIEGILNKDFIIEEALKYENNVNVILAEFNKIPDDYLLARDVQSIHYFDFFHTAKEVQLKKVLIKDPLVKTIDTVYDWTLLYAKGSIAATTEINISVDNSVTIACIPEIFFTDYKAVALEALDEYVLELLENAIILEDLLKQLEACFNAEDIKVNYDNFYQLILIKLKSLVYNKCIKIMQN